MSSIVKTKDGLLEKSSGRKVESPLDIEDELSDSLLLFRIIDPKTQNEYKMYATGQIEGFPPGCYGMNYFPSQAIKFMLAHKKTA